MSKSWDESLVDAYLAYARTRSEALFEAWEKVDGLVCRGNPDEAVELVLALVRRTPDDLIDYVAAGPVEDVLSYHGPQVVDRIVAEAHENPMMRSALRGVWGWSRMDTDVWRRVQDAAKA